MQYIFGSEIRGKILYTLSQKSSLTIKDIAKRTNVNYRSIYKIINELKEGGYVIQQQNKYSLTSKFISLVNNIQNNLVESYHREVFLEKKENLFYLIRHMDKNGNLEEKISSVMKKHLLKKLDKWYSEFYDPKEIETNTIFNTIKDNFSKNNKEIEVLEVGCGTGRFTKKLSQKRFKVTAIDKSRVYIDYCKEKFKSENIIFENTSFKKFEPNKKFDVILFSWTGVHNSQQHKIILENIKKISNENALIIIVDAYHNTEYMRILEELKPCNTSSIVESKLKLKKAIIEQFGNLNNEVIATNYEFNSISKVIEQIKIELCLEENYHWKIEDENKLKNILLKKEKPLSIGEGFWFASFIINSENLK